MFIETQSTPNPESLMFLIEVNEIPEGQTIFFENPSSCNESPLVRQLLDIEGVSSVLLGSHFITVTKQTHTDWLTLRPIVAAILADYHLSEQPILIARPKDDQQNLAEESTDVLFLQIKQMIDERVRPVVAADGGDIVFCDFEHETGTVYVKLMGACNGCPSASGTLKDGVESMLKYYIPEVKRVERLSSFDF